jgi:hypothetical protein
MAVGDGANDVSMIQAANVGVGIAGQEGVQASMAADYSIAQFRFLRKLLLVQGHWSYERISEMILNFFFKNLVYVFPALWYQIYSRFSGNLFYDYSFLQLYNLIFTVAPVVIIGKQKKKKSGRIIFLFIYGIMMIKIRCYGSRYHLDVFTAIPSSISNWRTAKDLHKIPILAIFCGRHLAIVGGLLWVLLSLCDGS